MGLMELGKLTGLYCLILALAMMSHKEASVDTMTRPNFRYAAQVLRRVGIDGGPLWWARKAGAESPRSVFGDVVWRGTVPAALRRLPRKRLEGKWVVSSSL